MYKHFWQSKETYEAHRQEWIERVMSAWVFEQRLLILTHSILPPAHD